MRTLDELGISPVPWEAEVFTDGHYAYVTARSVNGNKKIVGSEHSTADARLIAAAPELYEALREAVSENCHDCEDTAIDHCRGKCFVAKWRDVLAKASGESEVSND